MFRPSKILAYFFISILAGCATPTSVVNSGVRARFESRMSPYDLARCIDRNIDDYAIAGSLTSKIINSNKNSIEVVVLNGGTGFAVVRIDTSSTGSLALFFYGGLANMFPDENYKMMTTGCG